MSGVYIKMPMPTVPQTVIIYPDGTVADVYDGEKYKAIPVPDHGRLIDADSLDASVLQAGFSYAITRRKLRYTPGEVRQKIANAPTIIPEDKDGEA